MLLYYITEVKKVQTKTKRPAVE